MTTYSKWLLRIAALYSLIGGFMGSDLAGRKDFTMVPAHAHILVVGWLTLFAYGIFYYLFANTISMKKTAKLQAWTSMIGGGLMPISMLLYYKMPGTLSMVTFIVLGSVLLVGIALFTVLLFFDKQLFAKK
ncbi:MAG: hypothetical protein ACM32O_17640 [Clostridia bacterium]